MAEAIRKSLRHKSLPQTTEEKAKKARVEANMRSAIKLTAKQKYEKEELKPRVGVPLNLIVSKSIKRLELELRGGVPFTVNRIELQDCDLWHIENTMTLIYKRSSWNPFP